MHTVKVPIPDSNLPSLSSFRMREIVEIFSTLPYDYILTLRHDVAVFHHHPLLSLTESVAEITSEETHLWMLSSSHAPIQSASSPTLLAAPNHSSASRGSWIMGHCLVSQWTEDSRLVGPQLRLSRFHDGIANKSATRFPPAETRKALWSICSQVLSCCTYTSSVVLSKISTIWSTLINWLISFT